MYVVCRTYKARKNEKWLEELHSAEASFDRLDDAQSFKTLMLRRQFHQFAKDHPGQNVRIVILPMEGFVEREWDGTSITFKVFEVIHNPKVK
jgi:hypothetical protein